MVMSEDYYISNLDVWVLAEHFKLPIVFLSNTTSMLVENNENLLRLYGDSDGDFMFIKPPTYNRNINTNYDIIPHYKWIVQKDNNRLFKVDSLKDKIRKNTMTLQQYISNEVANEVVQSTNEVVANEVANEVVANEVANEVVANEVANEVVANEVVQSTNEVANKSIPNNSSKVETEVMPNPKKMIKKKQKLSIVPE
jgi:hypothetical protein